MSNQPINSYICLNCNTEQEKQLLPYKCIACGVKKLVLIDSDCSIALPLQQIAYHSERVRVLASIDNTSKEYFENVLHAANAIEHSASHIKYLLSKAMKVLEE